MGRTTEYTQSGNGPFWRTFHHDGKISPGWWGRGGGLHTSTPNLFHYIHHHVQSYRYAPAEQADTLALFHVYPYVLCGKNLCLGSSACTQRYRVLTLRPLKDSYECLLQVWNLLGTICAKRLWKIVSPIGFMFIQAWKSVLVVHIWFDLWEESLNMNKKYSTAFLLNVVSTKLHFCFTVKYFDWNNCFILRFFFRVY
jgi:hypothetical protein